MISEKDMALATDFVGQTSLWGWYASEKLNGCRAFWDGKRFWSRDGNVIRAPEWLKCSLPMDRHLDGEIHAGRGIGHGNHNSAYKVAMTAVVQGGKWWSELADDGRPIRFTVFDEPTAGGNWRNRIKDFPGGMCIDYTIIKNSRHLAEYMIDLHKKGAEGAMFRNPDEIGYHAGRTGALLRWKFEK